MNHGCVHPSRSPIHAIRPRCVASPGASRGVPSARPAPGPSLGPVLVKHHLTARPKNYAPRADKYAAPEKEGEFSAANLKVFADKFLAGELSVYEKPEEEESADDEEKKMPDYGVDGDEEMDGAGHDEM